MTGERRGPRVMATWKGPIEKKPGQKTGSKVPHAKRKAKRRKK